ncbi:hypothetical protein [Allohahella sp. A8]|uniref:hypothetical protein n=1 Tax=Allohahella sp. A8 TaxID=3141461 RepID=UPI003A80DEB4
MTIFRTHLLMLLAWAATASYADDYCAYGHTNQLVWNEHFERSLNEFFVGSRASLFWSNSAIADQVLTGLGGPPEKLRPLSEGYVLASACRADSCPEKAAVVLSCPDTVEAVAVIHYTCQESAEWQICTDKPVLTLFRDKNKASPVASSALKAWAINAVPKRLLPLTYDYRDRHNDLMEAPVFHGVSVLR